MTETHCAFVYLHKYNYIDLMF